MNNSIIKDKSIKIWESNILAVAPVNKILKQNSMRLFLWSMHKATKQWNFNENKELVAEFSLKDFAKYFNIPVQNSYYFAKKWTGLIQEYRYFIKDNFTDKFEGQVIIPNVKYDSGIIKATFAKNFTKHLLELKDNKIYIELKHLQKIKNPRFIKLYEYLKAKVYSGQINRIVNIEIGNLYKLLVVLKDTYKRKDYFIRYVLKPVINEFDKINDIKINKWEVIKLGNKISSVKFTVFNFSNDCIKEETKIKNRGLRCSSCRFGYFKPRRSESLKLRLENFDLLMKEEIKANPNHNFEYWNKEREIIEDKYEVFFYGCSNYPNCKKTLKTEEYDSLIELQNKI